MYKDSIIEVPTAGDIAAVSHLKDDTLRLPPFLKPKKGRPKETARKKSFLETKKKRTFHCSVCGDAAHWRVLSGVSMRHSLGSTHHAIHPVTLR